MRTLFFVAFLFAVAFAAKPTISNTMVFGYVEIWFYNSGCPLGSGYWAQIHISDTASLPSLGCQGGSYANYPMDIHSYLTSGAENRLPLSQVIETIAHDYFADQDYFIAIQYQQDDFSCAGIPEMVTMALNGYGAYDSSDDTGRDLWYFKSTPMAYLDGICTTAGPAGAVIGHRNLFPAVKTYYADSKCQSAPVAIKSFGAGYCPPFKFSNVMCDHQLTQTAFPSPAYDQLQGAYYTLDCNPAPYLYDYIDFGKLFGNQQYISRIDFDGDETCTNVAAFAAYDAECVLYDNDDKEQPLYLGALGDKIYVQCADPLDCPGSGTEVPISIDASACGTGNFIYHLPGEQDHARGQCTQSLCTSQSVCAETASCIDMFCLPLTEKSCDDKNPCTIDKCVDDIGEHGCNHTATLGVSCTPENLCIINAVCGRNQIGDPECMGDMKICTGDQCNDAACDFQTGNCVLTPKKNPPAICLSSSSGGLNAGSSLAACFSVVSLALFSVFAFVI